METVTIEFEGQTARFQVLSRSMFSTAHESACAIQWLDGYRPLCHATALLWCYGTLRLQLPGCSTPVVVLDVMFGGTA